MINSTHELQQLHKKESNKMYSEVKLFPCVFGKLKSRKNDYKISLVVVKKF